MEEEVNTFSRDIWCCLRDMLVIWFIAGKVVILSMAFIINMDVLTNTTLSTIPTLYPFFLAFDSFFTMVLIFILLWYLTKYSTSEYRYYNLISDGRNVINFLTLIPLCIFFAADLIMSVFYKRMLCPKPYFVYPNLLKIPILFLTMVLIFNNEKYGNLLLNFKGNFIRVIIILLLLISFTSDYANLILIYMGHSIRSNIIKYYNINGVIKNETGNVICNNGFLIMDRCLISFCACVIFFLLLMLISQNGLECGDKKELKGVKQELNIKSIIPSWVMVLSMFIVVLTIALNSLNLNITKNKQYILNLNFILISITSILEINEVRKWESLKIAKRTLDRLIIWIGFMSLVINSLYYLFINEIFHGILKLISTFNQTILFDLISTRYITRPKFNSFNSTLCPLYIIMLINAGLLVSGFRDKYETNKAEISFFYDSTSTMIDVNGNFEIIQRLHSFIYCWRIINSIYH